MIIEFIFDDIIKSQISRYLEMDDFKNDLYNDIVKLQFENGKSLTLVKKVLKRSTQISIIFQGNRFFVLLINLSCTGLSVTEEKICL